MNVETKSRAYMDYLTVLGYLSTIVGDEENKAVIEDALLDLYKIATEDKSNERQIL